LKWSGFLAVYFARLLFALSLAHAPASRRIAAGPGLPSGVATASEPHSYDLCEEHALRLTVPKGWEVVRHEGEFSAPQPSSDELTALAEAVREAGRSDQPVEQEPEAQSGRRGHLRVLPDPVNR
jgi:hypothetical protein